MHAFAWPMLIYFLAVMVLLCIYGLHRYWLLLRWWRHQGPDQAPQTRFEDLPRVTVQLPMYNESAVAERVIEAVAALDYPRDRLQIQVLDDSTDGCAAIARATCERLTARGMDMAYRHRTDRSGYKAGALAAALPTATGDFIAMFDADFVPKPDFLRRTIHHFTDDQIGLVQARWAHLNRDDSILTQAQALSLDGHFLIEQPARERSGAWFNFNGTAGIWRRATIDDAGGWTQDTLTEDTDLSYRAQMKGWQFRFLRDVTCPAELPPNVSALCSQQHRWSKGLLQCASKLTGPILRSRAPLTTRLEALFHLTAPLPYLALLTLSLIAVPAFFTRLPLYDASQSLVLWLGLLCLVLGTGAAASFYVAAGRFAGLTWRRSALIVLALMVIGVGLCVINSRAVLEALLGHRSGFVRTPKFAGRAGSARSAVSGVAGVVELTLGVLLTIALILAFTKPFTLVGAPFLALFAAGYLSIGIPRFVQSWRAGAPSISVLKPDTTTT